MIQIIPVINNKGGIGKTTTAVNVAAGLARRGKRTLLIDLDSQGSASTSLGLGETDRSIAAALHGEMPFGMTVHKTHLPKLSISPSSFALSSTSTRLAAQSDRVGRLLQVLTPVRMAYDVIVIDCPPSASLLSVNALVAADAFLVPVTPDYLSVQGLVTFDKMVRNVRLAVGHVAPILGVLLTQASTDAEQTREVYGGLRHRYGGKVLDTIVRPDEALQEAPVLGVDVFEYAPGSRGAEDYGAVVDEVISRISRYSAVFPDTGAGYISASRAQAIEAVADFDVKAEKVAAE